MNTSCPMYGLNMYIDIYCIHVFPEAAIYVYIYIYIYIKTQTH